MIRLNIINIKHITLFFVLFFINYFTSRAQNWEWAKSPVCYGGNLASSSIDADGNIIICGWFGGAALDSICFGSITLIQPAKYNSSFFVVKYDSSGNEVWGKNFSGSNTSPYTMCTDVYNNIYIVGTFADTLIVDGWSIVGNIVSGGSFLIKLNSFGEVEWAKVFSVDADYIIRQIATDNNGNILITGGVSNNFILYGTDTLFNSTYGDNIFITKLDSSGVPLWVQTVGDDVDDIGAGNIGIDGNNNVYWGGAFEGNHLNFGPYVLSNGPMFLAKYDSTGSLIWVKTAKNAQINSMATDWAGNTFIYGGFTNDTGIYGDLTLYGDPTAYLTFYVVKYDSSGNAIWGKIASGDIEYGFIDMNGLCIDQTDNIYISTMYKLPIAFGVDSVIPLVASQYNAIVVKYDEFGNLIWLKNFGGIGDTNYTSSGGDGIFGCNIDKSGNIYIAGNYSSDTIDFSPLMLIDSEVNPYLVSRFNMFLAKLSNPESLPILPNGSGKVAVYPNPGSGLVNVAFATPGYKELQVYDVLGREATSRTLMGNEWQTTLELSYLPSGVYYLRASGDSGTVIKSFVIRH